MGSNAIKFRYTVIVGKDAARISFESGPYVGTTRRELAELIRRELDGAGFPASAFKQARLRDIWPSIARYGSSSIHMQFDHGEKMLRFNGLTEEESDQMEREAD